MSVCGRWSFGGVYHVELVGGKCDQRLEVAGIGVVCNVCDFGMVKDDAGWLGASKTWSAGGAKRTGRGALLCLAEHKPMLPAFGFESSAIVPTGRSAPPPCKLLHTADSASTLSHTLDQPSASEPKSLLKLTTRKHAPPITAMVSTAPGDAHVSIATASETDTASHPDQKRASLRDGRFAILTARTSLTTSIRRPRIRAGSRRRGQTQTG